MSQSIVSLGIDVSSFSADKKNILNEFIALFDNLSKHDGKVINPVMGTGLVEFNKSVQQTGRLLDEIVVKLNTLKTQMASTGGGSAMNTSIQQSTNETNKATQATDKRVKKTKELTQAEKDYEQELRRVLASLYLQGKAYDDNEKAVKKHQAAIQAAEKAEVAALNKVAAERSKANKKSDAKETKTRDQQMAAIEAAGLKEEADLRRHVDKVQQEQIRTKREEEKINRVLLDEYGILRQRLRDQATEYANLSVNTGKYSAESRAALKSYKETEGAINSIDESLGRASTGVLGMGKSMSSLYNQIRTLAYILPGLGIAGIFNLAGQAIAEAADALGIFNSASENALKKQGELLALQKELISIADQVREAYKNTFGEENKASAELTYAGVGGKSAQTLLELQKSLLSIRADKSYKAYEKVEDLGTARQRFVEAELQLITLQERFTNASKSMLSDTDKLFGSQKDRIEKELAVAKQVYEIELDNYKKVKDAYQQNIDDRDALRAKEIEIEEFKAEELRKLILESAKLQVSANKSRNNIMLEDDRNFLAARIRGLRSNHQEEVKLIQAQLSYVKSRPDAVNQDGTLTGETKMAMMNADAAIAESRRRRDQAIEQEEINFYQRQIKAVIETNKNEIAENARKNEAIFSNTEKSLDERLKAYAQYIQDHQAMERLEYSLSSQRGAKGPGGKTSLTPEELTKLQSDRERMLTSWQADAEKKVYDIVNSSLDDRFKLIKDENERESTEMKRAHGNELRQLNNQYENKEMTYAKYRKLRFDLDEKYRRKELDEKLKDDDEDIARMEEHYNKLISTILTKMKAVQDARNSVASAKTPEDKRSAQLRLDTATGDLNANFDAIKKTEDELARLRAQRDKDFDAREQNRYGNLTRYEQMYLDEAKKIGDALLTMWSTVSKARTDMELAALEERKKALDEANQAERSGIEKSSIDYKNKTALEIQLDARKRESDKSIAAEQKRIKREQAEIDRAISIARITWSTAEGIINAHATLPPGPAQIIALERAILGAVQIATVLATPIPSYAEGTKDHPGGLARTGEAGPELIKEPYKSPYLVLRENISYLPKGTEVVPIRDDVDFDKRSDDDGWDQVRWLAKQIKKNKSEITNVIHNKVVVDFGFEMEVKRILGR